MKSPCRNPIARTAELKRVLSGITGSKKDRYFMKAMKNLSFQSFLQTGEAKRSGLQHQGQYIQRGKRGAEPSGIRDFQLFSI